MRGGDAKAKGGGTGYKCLSVWGAKSPGGEGEERKEEGEEGGRRKEKWEREVKAETSPRG